MFRLVPWGPKVKILFNLGETRVRKQLGLFSCTVCVLFPLQFFKAVITYEEELLVVINVNKLMNFNLGRPILTLQPSFKHKIQTLIKFLKLEWLFECTKRKFLISKHFEDMSAKSGFNLFCYILGLGSRTSVLSIQNWSPMMSQVASWIWDLKNPWNTNISQVRIGYLHSFIF